MALILERLRRGAAPAAGLVAALALAGCDSPGFSGRDAEIERKRGERGFAVLESGETRALFAANGERIAVEPPDGYCLDEESIAVTRRSAFVLVADCMHSHETALANGESGERLPRAFPGILTVTVSGEAVFGQEPDALPVFETLLETEAGGRLLGRGESTTAGEIVAMRRLDGALYVLIEERQAEGAGSIFAPRFWRAFSEVNGRLVLVTVSGFSDRPLGEGEMLAFLAAQMVELRNANGLPASADETELATLVMSGLRPAGSAEGTPVPRSRVVEAAAADGGAADGGAGGSGGTAPGRAPVAPRRPG